MRGELQQLLASRLPPSAEIQLSKDLVGLEEGPGGVVASFADGSSEEFDLVVGADGIRSAARGIMPARKRADDRVAHFLVAGALSRTAKGRLQLRWPLG